MESFCFPKFCFLAWQGKKELIKISAIINFYQIYIAIKNIGQTIVVVRLWVKRKTRKKHHNNGSCRVSILWAVLQISYPLPVYDIVLHTRQWKQRWTYRQMNDTATLWRFFVKYKLKTVVHVHICKIDRVNQKLSITAPLWPCWFSL